MRRMIQRCSKIVYLTIITAVIASMVPPTASAATYAVAYMDYVATCTGNPGYDCDQT